jgi:hypothetical protein
MTLQRLILVVVVAFVALFVITMVASYTLWSSGDNPGSPSSIHSLH